MNFNRNRCYRNGRYDGANLQIKFSIQQETMIFFIDIVANKCIRDMAQRNNLFMSGIVLVSLCKDSVNQLKDKTDAGLFCFPDGAWLIWDFHIFYIAW